MRLLVTMTCDDILPYRDAVHDLVSMHTSIHFNPELSFWLLKRTCAFKSQKEKKNGQFALLIQRNRHARKSTSVIISAHPLPSSELGLVTCLLCALVYLSVN